MMDFIGFALAAGAAYLIAVIVLNSGEPETPPSPPSSELEEKADWYQDIRAREFVNEVTGERVPIEGGGVFRHIETQSGQRRDSFYDMRPVCPYCRTRIRVDSKHQCVGCGAPYQG